MTDLQLTEERKELLALSFAMGGVDGMLKDFPEYTEVIQAFRDAIGKAHNDSTGSLQSYHLEGLAAEGRSLLLSVVSRAKKHRERKPKAKKQAPPKPAFADAGNRSLIVVYEACIQRLGVVPSDEMVSILTGYADADVFLARSRLSDRYEFEWIDENWWKVTETVQPLTPAEVDLLRSLLARYEKTAPKDVSQNGRGIRKLEA